MHRKWLTVLGAFAFATLVAQSAHAQYNPDGFIQGQGWTHTVLRFGTGCDGGGIPRMMSENWAGAGVDLRDISTALPGPADDTLGPGPQYILSPLTEGRAFWLSVDAMNAAFPPEDGNPDRWNNTLGGNVMDYNGFLERVQDHPDFGLEDGAIPNNDVYAISHTYINVVQAGTYDFCVGSDDSIMVIVDDQIVHVNSICRGGGNCQDRAPVYLAEGNHRIVLLVWEGGGGFNGRCRIFDRNGVAQTDSEDDGIVFLGPDPVGDLSPAATVRRVLSDGGQFAPTADNTVTIRSSETGGGEATATVVERITPHGAEISNISHGGTVADDTIDFTPESNVNEFGFLKAWVHLGPLAQGGGAGPAVADIEMDYLAGDNNELDVEPQDGDVENIDFGVAASTGFVGSCLGPDGRWTAVFDANDTIDYNADVYCGDINNVMMYSVTYVKFENDLTGVRGGVASDDSVQVIIDGVSVFSRSVPRGFGGANSVQDQFDIGDLSAGYHKVMIKVFEGGGGHGFRFRFQNSDDTPITEGITCFPVPNFADDSVFTIFTGNTITWENVSREDLNGGVSYQLGGGPDVWSVFGYADGVGGTRNMGFASSNTRRGAGNKETVLKGSGPVGIFDQAHDTGNANNPDLAFDGTDYTQVGNGSDIWQDGDSFHFAYKKVTGDFTARAHIKSRVDPVAGSRWGKHGIMARYSTDTDARYTQCQTNVASSNEPIDLPRLQRRVNGFHRRDQGRGSQDNVYVVDDGALRNTPDGGFGNPADRITRRPEHMMMIRRGQVISVYMAFDDGEGNPDGGYCFVGSDDHAGLMPDEVLVGMSLTAHSGNQTTVVYSMDIQSDDVETLGTGAGDTELALLTYDDDSDLGIVVDNDTNNFSPAAVDGRLRVTEDGTGGQAHAVYYGVPASGDAGAALIAEGFSVEFDAYMSKGDGGCDPAADPNPADGFQFTVIATGAEDGLASALAPFPGGLDLPTLLGGGGGGLAYDSGAVVQRAECFPSFGIEMDNWVGGNDPGDAGSPGFDCNWHLGVNVNGSVLSIQDNVRFGVPTDALPSIFAPEGVHVEVTYLPSGQVDAYVTANDGSTDRMHVLSTHIAPLPAGDLVLGFNGATGGATAHQEVDNVRLASVCTEAVDSVAIEGCPSEAADSSLVELTAAVGGADGAVTYEWSVEGGSIVGDATGATIMVQCEIPEGAETGEVTVSVSTADGGCGDTATASCSFTCVSGGTNLIPGDLNLSAQLDVSDMVFLLNALFAQQEINECVATKDDQGIITYTEAGLALADWNGDGDVNIADAAGGLNWLFASQLPGNVAHVLADVANAFNCVQIPGDCPSYDELGVGACP